MKLATRINSFMPQYNHDIQQVFAKFNQLGLTHVDLNYPEHVSEISSQTMRSIITNHNLQVNGVALRFRKDFINGELGNMNQQIANQALALTKEAADYCRELGGKVVTIWLGFDGFDYSFQLNYQKVWEQLVNAFQTIADYAPDLKISIEYKPFQPRAYAFIDSMGVAGMMLNAISRDNVGITLDYCHMLMKHENPAFAADLFGHQNKLFGVHLNDGYGLNDDGLMIGTSTPIKTLEFLYYVKKHNYQHAIYFDTFPVIEHAFNECQQNIKMIQLLINKIDKIGLEAIQKVIDRNDAIEASNLILEFLS